MKRWEIEELHQKLFGPCAFIDFEDMASDVRDYIKEHGYPKFDDYGNLIVNENDKKISEETIRRNQPMAVTVGQWEDLVNQVKELQNKIK